MAIPYQKIVKEDLDLGYGTTDVRMPGGGEAIGNKVGLHTFTGMINVVDVGADNTGSVDSTNSIQDAIDSVGAGGTVWFPSGTYKVTATITVTKAGVTLRGAGKYSSIIDFEPTGNDTCFLFTKGTAILQHNIIKDLAFQSDNILNQKIAIELWDVSETVIENVVIGYASKWTGATSVGIRIRGREIITLRKVTSFADRPLWIQACMNTAPTDLDNIHIEDWYSNALDATDANIYIDGTDININNFSMDGENVFIGGLYGIYWNGGNRDSSYWDIKNIRHEQGAPTWTLYLNHSYLYQLVLDNVAFTSDHGAANGAYLRKVYRSTIRNCTYWGANTSINTDDATNSDIQLYNNRFTGTMTTGNYIQLEGDVLYIRKSSLPVSEVGSVQLRGTTTATKKLALGIDESVGGGYGWAQAVNTGTDTIPLALQPNGGKVYIGTNTVGTVPVAVIDGTSIANAIAVHVSSSAAAWLLFPNAKYLASKDVGGTTWNLIGINASDVGKIMSGLGRIDIADGGGKVAIATTANMSHKVAIPNAQMYSGINAGGTDSVACIGVDSADCVHLASGGADIRIGKALVALGGGAAPTLGTIGGSGPTSAAQNSWLRLVDSGGNVFWVPVWK